MPGEDPETLATPADIAPLFLDMLSPSFDKTGETLRYTG
jgi:hypothetical protein